ncbi:hypothetical protein BKA58DRAFT_34194 [Alternaria rosae]|uniref:uncharacterized protein n=1 Tax=Alternaria rosae TaxID=1187941 RepID=UPI001E8D6821|nr:uncharacterized protein BKA58DRAFT_34194 [Alternaria rosae]KAH6883293.1 hypothetical protein BKA58DRAFT_34194 [Alternaria rosae]
MRFNTLILFLIYILPTTLALRPRPWTPKDPCPTSIKAYIHDEPCRSDDCDPDHFAFTSLNSVHSALLTCPNISSLDISIWGFCSTWPDRMDLPLSPFGGETYPDIKSLQVLGYYGWDRRESRNVWNAPKCLAQSKLECFKDTLYWYYKRHWQSWLAWCTQSKHQLEKTNAELWLDAMDWKCIEELSVDTVPDSVRKVLSQSRALRKLKTTDGELILNLPKNMLTHLSLVNGERDTALFDDILNHQGGSLESLEMRWDTEHHPWRYNGDLDDEILIITKSAKKLRHLSMNVLRNATSSPLETLEKIATIPTLREADLWIQVLDPWNLGADEFSDQYKGETRIGPPLLSHRGALSIFRYMRDKKQGEELEKVTFWVGDWTDNWYEDDPRVKVACEAKTDVDMKDWCVGEDEWPQADFQCGTL